MIVKFNFLKFTNIVISLLSKKHMDYVNHYIMTRLYKKLPYTVQFKN